jgi:glyceraldehyde-3-phosphate dehydrogenase/erythrose-4-phosphate dehydrogenase
MHLEKINFGIAGMGSRGKLMAELFVQNKNIKLTSVCDRNDKSLHEYELKGIKILDNFNKYSIWFIDEELSDYYRISLVKDRGRITTINKRKTYKKDDDPHYLYSDFTISLDK